MVQPPELCLPPPSARSHGGSGAPSVVRLDGDYDLADVAALSSRLSAAVAAEPTDLVVDLSGVSFMDASTIGVIVGTRASLHAQAHSLWLRDPSPCARRILGICDLDALIEPDTGADDHDSTAPVAALEPSPKCPR